ncbi:hypothetical protein [Halorientalis salina]|uniref:hypothetical protein n=1 Tax=Halorientalis salina TaxID=2932266 RepID=UPI0010AC08EA|nr:hypothetical protein [Halorientalis salina]
MGGLDEWYGVQQFAVFAVLAHLPLVVEVPTSTAILASWYVTMLLVGVLALVTNLGRPAVVREYAGLLGNVEVFLCGVGCGLVTVVLLGDPSPTPSGRGLAVVSSGVAVVLAAAGLGGGTTLTALFGRG